MRISSLLLFLAYLGVITAVAAKDNTETKKSGDDVTKAQGLMNQLQSEVKGIKDSHDKTSKELNELFKLLDETQQHLSDTTKQKEMAEKLGEMQVINDALKAEIAESRRNQAELLNHVIKLLERLDEKDSALSNVTMEKNELLEKVTKVTGLNKSIESEIQDARAGLLQATSAAAVAESTVTSLRGDIEELRRENESLQEQLDESRDNISEEWQVDAAAESTGKSLRSVIEELHRENESHNERVNNRIDSDIQDPDGLLQANSADAVLESTVASFHSDTEELCRENESFHKQLNESRDSISEEQQVDAVPLTSTSSIGFDDVTTTTHYTHIPNGYRGLNWENVRVVHRSVHQGSGYEYGTVSGDYVAFINGGRPCSISSTTPFSVAGFQATAAWSMGLNVLVESFDNSGNLIGSYQTTLGDPRNGPTFIDLRRERNFEGLTQLKITSSDGTDAGMSKSATRLAIDDMLVY